METELTISGPLLTCQSSDDETRLIDRIARGMATSAQDYVHQAFERSSEIAAYDNTQPDLEVSTTIKRSLKVTVDPSWPLGIVGTFSDDFQNWWAESGLPDSFITQMQAILDKSLQEWSDSPQAAEALVTAINDEPT